MKRRHLTQDLYLMLASIVLAWAIVHFGVVDMLLANTGGHLLLASFVAGLFFTSVLTTAPAVAVLGVLSLHLNPFVLAVCAAAGSVCGDYIIFMFVRDRLVDDMTYLLARTKSPRFFKIFHRNSYRWLLPLFGGLIIASPLPDELGLALMGLTGTRAKWFVLISFTFNVIGILLVSLAAHALA